MAIFTSAVLVLALVAVCGQLIGHIRIKGIGLGAAGVLFAGILFGHFGATIDHEIGKFVKEFGLILFVFSMGIHLGPGIVQLWKRQGLQLNLLATAIVLQGLVLVIILSRVFNFTVLGSAGLFCGSTTNTPSLGAAEQAADMLASAPNANLEGLGKIDHLATAYAVTYPGAIVGIIASMLLLRRLLNINVDSEALQLIEQERVGREPVERCCIVVDNVHLDGIEFGQIPGTEETGVRISRIQRKGDTEVAPATEQTQLHVGDAIAVVGTQSGLKRFIPLIGQITDQDLLRPSVHVEFRRVFVTETRALNKPLRELSLDQMFRVTVTRIIRADVEMSARGSSQFHYGDIAHIVGDKQSLDRVTEYLGNSAKALQNTPFLPLFAGIAAGVLLGMIPLRIPGVPFPVQLGLAGGPLLAAIVFSIVGNIGKFVWYIPHSANLALQQLGIILFLASTGLGAGSSFFASAMSREGMILIFMGLVVTMLPLLTTGLFARLWGKHNFLTICGVIAGSMTDPPALAFANSLSESEGSSTAYAAVYPLTMVLRILAAQAIVFSC